MIGRVYRWRGELWQVKCRWSGGPKNVLLENVRTGGRVTRPFRGLRRATVWIIATSECFHVSKRCAEARGARIGWRAFPLEEATRPAFYRPCGICTRERATSGESETAAVAAARAARYARAVNDSTVKVT